MRTRDSLTRKLSRLQFRWHPLQMDTKMVRKVTEPRTLMERAHNASNVVNLTATEDHGALNPILVRPNQKHHVNGSIP